MHVPKKNGAENPQKTANWLSRLVFIWLIPMIYKGTKEGLGSKDMFDSLDIDNSELLGDKLEAEWRKQIEEAKIGKKKPSLSKALLKVYGLRLGIEGISSSFNMLLRILVPVVLAQLLVQYQKSSTMLINGQNSTSDFERNMYAVNQSSNIINLATTNREIGNSSVELDLVDYSTDGGGFVIFNNIYWLSFWLIFVCIVSNFSHHHTDLRLRMIGAQIRIGCCSLIYRKTLQLSKKSTSNISTGYVVNLMSNDVARFDYVLIFIHYIWLLPIQAILVGLLIWPKLEYIGVICIVGLLLKTVPVQTGLGRLLSIYRSKIALITDERVGVMNEIIRGIQVIKMYAWEKSFAKMIANIRWKEVKSIRVTGYLKAINTSAMVITERSTLLIALICCVFLDEPITADVVFSLALFFNSLQLTAANFYPFALSFASEALVSIKRIEEYLMLDDQIKDSKNWKVTPSPDDASEGNAISTENVVASWEMEAPMKTLQNININIKQGQLCAIIGPVGAGKSSFLELLLGELPIESGSCLVNGSVSYSAQEAWIFTGTIRSNILFDEPYNKTRYQDVVRCCALNTDFMQLQNGDRTLVGERGASLSGGQQARINLARAIYKTASIYLLDDPLSAVDARVGRHLFNEVIGPEGFLAREHATRLLVTHQVHLLKEADWIVVLDNGRILKQGTYNELAASNLNLVQILNKSTDSDDDDRMEEDGDSYTGDGLYRNRMSSRRGVAQGSVRISRISRMSVRSAISEIFDEEESVERIDQGGILQIWKKYMEAAGNMATIAGFGILILVSQVMISCADYFVNFWTQDEQRRLTQQPTWLTTHEALTIFGVLIAIVVLLSFTRTISFYYLSMRASRNLHNQMFSRILAAPMRFFDLNPSGRILNRFSKDMGTIDELLPKTMMDGIQITCLMIGILVLVSILNPVMIVALLFAVILFAIILKMYMRPAQDMKRLEGVARSPVFTHLAASLVGISTIRARGHQTKLVKSFDFIQDNHSGIWYQMNVSNVALGLWMDLVSSAFIGCVAFGFTAIRDKTSSGDVGLALSQALTLTGMVQYGFRQIAESIQFMTSIERIVEYAEIQEEPKIEMKSPKNWPTNGRIEMRNVYLHYNVEGPPTLKNLQVLVEHGWKVGIVGRTGAGKSSLINAIFRLSPIQGQILIDEIDTASISLECLRSKISIIPQDPVLFSATVRDNLDPFHMFTDDELWRALEDVELKSAINSLDFMVTESGGNFSVGQRQLICLARAILRNNQILILDEATANVDPQTDALIQDTIREKFERCTILTIAHRLHTVMDADRILVMDNGTISEFDAPHILVQKDNGILRGMVDATGPQESTHLKQIARETFVKF